MAIVEQDKSYVTWADVNELTRYLEAGYGCRIAFKMTVACPKGEQYLKQYWELYWCDSALQERPMAQRVLGSFPTRSAKNLASLFLGLLYTLDNILSQEAVWTEPTIAAQPRRGRPTQ